MDKTYRWHDSTANGVPIIGHQAFEQEAVGSTPSQVAIKYLLVTSDNR